MKIFNNKKFYILALLLSLAMAISSCISLKSDYPDIKYYKLEQTKSLIDNIQPINAALMVRSFTSASQIDGDRMVAYNQDNVAQRYFYHRWAADVPDLISDFIIERFNKLEAFSGGALRTSVSQSTNYILEGDILEMHAYNAESKNDSNYVKYSLRVSLLKHETKKVNLTLLIQKTYSISKIRPDNSVSSIAPAMNIAVAEISDNLLSDILKAIAEDKSEK